MSNTVVCSRLLTLSFIHFLLPKEVFAVLPGEGFPSCHYAPKHVESMGYPDLWLVQQGSRPIEGSTDMVQCCSSAYNDFFEYILKDDTQLNFSGKCFVVRLRRI